MKCDVKALMTTAWQICRDEIARYGKSDFASVPKYVWRMTTSAMAEARRHAGPNRARIKQLVAAPRETDYLPSHMHTTRRNRVAAIQGELAALGASA